MWVNQGRGINDQGDFHMEDYNSSMFESSLSYKIAGRKRPALVDPSHKEAREVQTDGLLPGNFRFTSGPLPVHFRSTGWTLDGHRTDTGRTDTGRTK